MLAHLKILISLRCERIGRWVETVSRGLNIHLLTTTSNTFKTEKNCWGAVMRTAISGNWCLVLNNNKKNTITLDFVRWLLHRQKDGEGLEVALALAREASCLINATTGQKCEDAVNKYRKPRRGRDLNHKELL